MEKVRWTGSERQKPPIIPEQPHNPPVPPEDKHTTKASGVMAEEAMPVYNAHELRKTLEALQLWLRCNSVLYYAANALFATAHTLPKETPTTLHCAVEHCDIQHDLGTVRLWYTMEDDFLVLCAHHRRAFEAMTGTLSPIPLAMLEALRAWYEAESRPPVVTRGSEPSPSSRLYQATADYFGPARPTTCEMPTCGKAFTDGEPFYWMRPSDAVAVALCREHHRFVSPH